MRRAAAATGTRPEDWLDLSTGISPYPWPVPAIPPACWQRLPEEEDGLVEAAQVYSGAPAVLPVSGTQCAIQLLPRLRPPGRVAVLGPTYAEHAHAWKQHGHAVREISADALETALEEFDVVVAVNPNNPTGILRPRETLLRWHENLSGRGGWLVVDEAFMDATPQYSVSGETHREGLIVLRSFGKFFGCPGARLGFAAARPETLEALRELAGPWAVSGPARWIGQRALLDTAWQESARARLVQTGQELAALLTAHGLAPSGGTPLFQWARTANAERMERHFLRQRILPRRFREPASLRFGLPCGKEGWKRLREALETLP